MKPMTKILIIDDEPQIRRLLALTLESCGWKVHEAEDGLRGLHELALVRPDAVLLDLGLPGMGGIEVLKRLREWSQVPVLILSVRDQPEDKVEALEAGADDYVTKPFEPTELLARCRAIMRRRDQRVEEPIFVNGNLEVDFTARRVRVAGKSIDLTSIEYDLLRLLAINVGKVLTHSHILRTIWGPKAEEQRQYLRVHLAALRRKLGEAAQIKTETGIGYRMESA
jgi:two-component system, OmpR family, KDP operon response regulator KdpE